jgi:hypothetical protein
MLLTKYEYVKCSNDVFYIMDEDTGMIVQTTDEEDTARSIVHHLNTNNSNDINTEI